MEGITILNEFVVNNAPAGWVAIIFGSILTIVCLVGMFLMIGWRDSGLALIFGILAMVWAGLIFLGISIAKTPPETRYQVLIDESVSMTEFFEKYEIIEQEGKIYTIKEKER
jgi:hypothetical protein